MRDLLLDANVLVRFLVQDDASQSPAATALFQKAERGEFTLHLDGFAVAEVVYVLTGRHGRKRMEVSKALLALIQNPGVAVAEEGIVADALRRFGSTNVDFADAWLAARAARQRRAIASFDRDFDRFKDIQGIEPKI